MGTAARLLASLAIPNLLGIPLSILGINVVGALALGFLLEALARSGPDLGRYRRARLLLGTGLLGGFTTFSTLAVASAELLNAGRPFAAAGYALGTVILGAVCTTGGIALAGRLHARAEGSRR